MSNSPYGSLPAFAWWREGVLESGEALNPIVRPNENSLIPTDVPHRLIVRGTFGLPAQWEIAPVVEIRSGFPWSAVDEFQDFAIKVLRAVHADGAGAIESFEDERIELIARLGENIVVVGAERSWARIAGGTIDSITTFSAGWSRAATANTTAKPAIIAPRMLDVGRRWRFGVRPPRPVGDRRRPAAPHPRRPRGCHRNSVR